MYYTIWVTPNINGTKCPPAYTFPGPPPLRALERPVLNKFQQNNANLLGKRMWQREPNYQHSLCRYREGDTLFFHIACKSMPRCRQSIAWYTQANFISDLVRQLQAHCLPFVYHRHTQIHVQRGRRQESLTISHSGNGREMEAQISSW